MLIRLSGTIDETPTPGTTDQRDRRALLIYAGVFESLDGTVEVTPEHLQRLVEQHNSKIDELGDRVRLADYPPIQLDHSTSAKDTVGRVIGKLELSEDENKRPCIYGNCRFLGTENLEKVADGRWTHLSIGADLEAGKLIELTITPFPAAQNACLLAKGALGMDEDTKMKCLAYMVKQDNISEDEAKTRFETMNDEEKAELAKRMAEPPQEDKQIHLNDDEENDENEEEKEIKIELTAALKSAKTKADAVRLALKQTNIKNRIARLRAQAKITPAEIKKMDFSELYAANDVTVEAVLKSYENRQPVLFAGQYGTLKGMSPGELVADLRNKELENEVRSYFSSLGSGKPGVTKFEAGSTETVERQHEVTQVEDNLSTFDQIVRAIQENDLDKAKKLFGQYADPTDVADGSTTGSESALASLMSAFAELETQFCTITRLAGKRFGIQI